MADDVKPWHRQTAAGESRPAYHAFQHFRDLPLRARSLDRAYTWCLTVCPRDKNTLNGKPGPKPEKLPEPLKEATKNWKQWRRRFQWDSRTDAYDRQLDEDERLDRIEKAKRANEEDALIASAAIRKLIAARVQTMNASDVRTPRQLADCFETLSTIRRRALGEATQLVKTINQNQPAAPLDLSNLSESEIETMLALLAKANGENVAAGALDDEDEK